MNQKGGEHGVFMSLHRLSMEEPNNSGTTTKHHKPLKRLVHKLVQQPTAEVHDASQQEEESSKSEKAYPAQYRQVSIARLAQTTEAAHCSWGDMDAAPTFQQ